MAPQGQQNNTTNTANFAWLLVLVVVLMLLLWWFQRSLIVHVIFSIRMLEIYVMTYAFDAINSFLTALGFSELSQPYWYQWGQSVVFGDSGIDYSKVPWGEVANLSVSTGRWLNYFFSIVCAFFLYLLLFKHSGARFSRVFSMKSLRESEVSIWPAITPIMGTNLVKAKVDEGPWAMAKLPQAFSEEHELLHVEKNERGDKYWAIHENKAEAVFAKQLGPLWRGVEHAPTYIQALAVIFVSKAERKTDLSKSLLKQLALSSSGRLDFSGVAEHIKECSNNRIIKWLEKRHAYTSTFMASLLDVCRSEGVLATSEFLWLKAHDRPLWYILNSVGRQTAMVEAAGPFAHWQAERKLKRALKTPMVTQAVAALSEAMLDILYVEKEDSWRTSNEA